MKSRNLKFLEPSGPLQACNGTALPLPFTVTDYEYTYDTAFYISVHLLVHYVNVNILQCADMERVKFFVNVRVFINKIHGVKRKRFFSSVCFLSEEGTESLIHTEQQVTYSSAFQTLSLTYHLYISAPIK